MKNFFSLFILLLISNLLVFTNYILPGYQFSTFLVDFTTVLSFASATALFLSLILKMLERYPLIKKIANYTIYTIVVTILTVETLLVVNFNTTFYPTMFNILAETNPSESWQFIATYINFNTIFYIFTIAATIFFIIKFVPKIVSKISRKALLAFIIISSIIAVVRFGSSAYTFVKYKTGQNIPQYSSILRLGSSYYAYLRSTKENDILINNLKNCTILENKSQCDIVVVVIGESHSKYHSQIYGYEKETMPKLQERSNNGELFIFNDVITTVNGTSGSVRSILSLSEAFVSRYSDYELFPCTFKNAGYYSIYADNQHLATNSNNIIESETLSDLIYNKRNDTLFKYDMELFDWVKTQYQTNAKNLIIIKINGQHYTYNNRYPKEWDIFNASDYEHLDLSQDKRQIIADYDNATLYNDFFIDSLVSHFKEDNAAIVYMSDHGEEIYDYRNYMGHGGNPEQLKYQIEIPFAIWLSDAYKELNPQIASNIAQNINKPYTTDDVAHLLLDIAGIKSKQFNPSRSIANDAFKPRSKRLIMNSIIYEDTKE